MTDRPQPCSGVPVPGIFLGPSGDTTLATFSPRAAAILRVIADRVVPAHLCDADDSWDHGAIAYGVVRQRLLDEADRAERAMTDQQPPLWERQAMTDQQQQPLWKVLRDAYDQSDNGIEDDWNVCLGYAAELRAIADAMVLVFDPWLQEHSDVADWLCAEADRAEAGE